MPYAVNVSLLCDPAFSPQARESSVTILKSQYLPIKFTQASINTDLR